MRSSNVVPTNQVSRGGQHALIYARTKVKSEPCGCASPKANEECVLPSVTPTALASVPIQCLRACLMRAIFGEAQLGTSQ